MKTKKQHDTKTTVQELKDRMNQFVTERDWKIYHNPKTISMSIAIEAAELMEKFQYFTNEESVSIAQEYKKEVADELADVLANIFNFANITDIDLSTAFIEKMKLNIEKYPVGTASGNYGRYTKLADKTKK